MLLELSRNCDGLYGHKSLPSLANQLFQGVHGYAACTLGWLRRVGIFFSVPVEIEDALEIAQDPHPTIPLDGDITRVFAGACSDAVFSDLP